jgi:hypothetical protein
MQIFDLDWNQYDSFCHESCHVCSPLHHTKGKKSWPGLLERICIFFSYQCKKWKCSKVYQRRLIQ